MKKLFNFIASLAVLFSCDTFAMNINLVADKSNLNIGDTLELQVRVSGLDDQAAPSLGVYDLNLGFDAALFSLSAVHWGDSVLGNQLDLAGFGSLQESTLGANWLNLFELSFDSIADLDLLQAGDFTLFSVLLTAQAIGEGNLSLWINALGDASGNALSATEPNGLAVTVGGVEVPEPSSLLLLLGALAIFALRVRKLQYSR
ncbi:MAG: hypothetical protein B0W54_17985 [Cellvibrio sp. 79]|nr:MAG: hypothetical protein B0W54_17985 [Cellvibrio sp. 79]